MYICALYLLWKWQIIPILIKHSVTYSKFVFHRGYPNKMISTQNHELILIDHYGSGRCCNTFQTHQTFTKTQRWVHSDRCRWQWKKVTMTTFLFQCCVFRISFIVFLYADLSVLWQVLDCSIGLTCVAWSSAANAPNARTEKQSRAVWRWAAYWTPN